MTIAERNGRPRTRRIDGGVPPHDADAERSVVGSILIDAAAIEVVAGILRPDDFYVVSCRRVYDELLAMRREGVPIDVQLLLGRLKAAGADAIVSRTDIAEMADCVPTASNVGWYGQIVLQKAQLRRAHFAAFEVEALAEDNYLAANDPLAWRARFKGVVERVLGENSATVPAEPRLEYELLDCSSLDSAEYELEYLVDHVLVAGQPCIFAGGKKTLKTSLLIALAMALAMGLPFLGRFAVRRAARVLMMTGESGLATIQETARRIAAAMGLSLGEVTGLILSPQLPLFGNLLHMDALRETLKANEIEVLIVDPAYLAMPTGGNEASLFAMGALLRAMAEICQECGVTFILAHHTRKTITDPFAPPELEDIAWAGFNEFARQWVLIGRRERYEPGSGEHRLWLNAGGSAGHSSCWALDVAEGVYDGHTPRQWQVSLKRAEEARQEAEQRQEGAKDEKRRATSAAHLEADRKAIVAAAIKFKGEAFTFAKLRERAGIQAQRFGAAFGSLSDDGLFVDSEVTGRNKQAYPGYRLKESSE
ncbi:MAG TPA: AAA family ATPase [Pirellulales bacterium]|nr:AAA family ATPase [Pirellulales bacterium]